MLVLGCHLSASDGNLVMVNTAKQLGANTFAYFTRNPRGSKAKKSDPAQAIHAMGSMALEELSHTVHIP